MDHRPFLNFMLSCCSVEFTQSTVFSTARLSTATYRSREHRSRSRWNREIKRYAIIGLNSSIQLPRNFSCIILLYDIWNDNNQVLTKTSRSLQSFYVQEQNKHFNFSLQLSFYIKIFKKYKSKKFISAANAIDHTIS